MNNLFELIEEAQQLHGLRTDDYVRYRRYCTRKLERLRNKFNLHHTTKSQVNVSLELCKTNPEALHLILFKLEWFWAQINQLRNELSKNQRKKYHLKLICMNSLKYIKNLMKLSQDASIGISSSLRLEYLAYINSFEGIVRNELKEFSTAIGCLQKSKIIIEELDNRGLKSEVYHKKLSELDTIMRVCQYSADMHDIVIDFNEEDLNSVKMNLLTDKISESELIGNRNDFISLSLGSKTFIARGIQELTENNLRRNLLISRQLLKKSTRGEEVRDSLLQVGYFENLYFEQQIGRKLIKIARKGLNSVNLQVCLKKLIRSKGYDADESFTRAIDLLSNLLFNLLKVQEGTENVSSSALAAISAIELIENESEMIKKYKFSFLDPVLKYQNALKGQLNSKINGQSMALMNFPSAPVPPKPSFYDLVLDSLDYKIVQKEPEKRTSGLSNILSSLWGIKK